MDVAVAAQARPSFFTVEQALTWRRRVECSCPRLANHRAARLAGLLQVLANLGFELGLEGRVEFEVAGQFVKVGALHEVLLVDHQHTGHVHFRGHFRGTGGTRHIGRIQRLVQLGVQPALGFTVAGQFAEFAFDQFALALVDMAIGLGQPPAP